MPHSEHDHWTISLVHSGQLRSAFCGQPTSALTLVRDGKGAKDRITMLPAAVKEALLHHLHVVKRQHQDDLSRGLGWVALPNALERKYPNPATSHYTDSITGDKRRHHLHECVLQRRFKEARPKAGISKPATPLRPTCWRTGMICGRSKSCWTTRT